MKVWMRYHAYIYPAINFLAVELAILPLTRCHKHNNFIWRQKE